MHRIEKIKISLLINKTEKSLVIKAKRPKLVKLEIEWVVNINPNETQRIIW